MSQNCLLQVVAYSPHPGVDWQTSWEESPTSPLVGLIPEVIKKVLDASAEPALKKIQANEAAARHQRGSKELQKRRRG